MEIWYRGIDPYLEDFGKEEWKRGMFSRRTHDSAPHPLLNFPLMPFLRAKGLASNSSTGLSFDFLLSHGITCCAEKGYLGIQDHSNRDGLEQWPHSAFGRKSVHKDWVS